MRKIPSSLPSQGASAAGHDRNHVASLAKGLEVLCAFGRAHSRLTVSEVAALTGATPASARRSLLTLHALGYLASDGKHYWMLPRALLIAHAYLSSRATPSLAQPLLDGLSERTRQSASLGKLLDNDVIIIARSTARRSLSTGLGIGSRLPAYCSALGRVLLASLPPAEARRRLQAMQVARLTPRTETDPARLLDAVAACRERGHATSDEELETGVRSMAVPVFMHDGRTVAGLSISVRAERMGLEAFRETMLPILLRAQAQLARQLYQD
jgi:IclR family pca regulon transcriptional regulator